MEPNETAPLITKFRSAHAAGVEFQKDISKKGRLRLFLGGARTALRLLYGIKAPVLQQYADAIKHFRDLTEEQHTALFVEFESILNSLEFLSGRHPTNSISHPCIPPAGRNVFIIHGHDETNKLRLQTLLRDHFGLNPVVMANNPGMGRGLLQKFEDSASPCSLAFALITPDDEIANHGEPYTQARPNVIFEAGWFSGRLGIPRVCLLLKEGTTVQSDIDGISRIHFAKDVNDKVLEIQRELKAVGLVS